MTFSQILLLQMRMPLPAEAVEPAVDQPHQERNNSTAFYADLLSGALSTATPFRVLSQNLFPLYTIPCRRNCIWIVLSGITYEVQAGETGKGFGK